MSLHDLLKQDVQKMIGGIGRNEKGNVYSLIIQEVEKSIIEIALQESKNNYVRAARMLGISRSRLYRRIQKLDIVTKWLEANVYRNPFNTNGSANIGWINSPILLSGTAQARVVELQSEILWADMAYYIL